MYLFCRFIFLYQTIFFILLGHVNSKAYFGIGNRYDGDKLLLRDEVENRHTGLTEVPVIAFEYAVKEPITYIEITSEENVLATVHFSYYDALINGTVVAMTSNITPEGLNQPFSIRISIYGFNEMIPESFDGDTLRQKQYTGPLTPHRDAGEIDHMELKVDTKLSETELIEDFKPAATQQENDESSEEIEAEEDNLESFENFDLFLALGHRQTGDELLFETYQTSEEVTKNKTEHFVTFYFIDNVFITHFRFVLIDYKSNKTPEEIEKGYYITYAHYTQSTMKAVIYDYKTTSLTAKMYVFGYKEAKKPENYVSFIPERYQNQKTNFFNRFFTSTTELPDLQFRAKSNNFLQQIDSYSNIPAEFYKSQHGEAPSYVITSIKELRNSGDQIKLPTLLTLFVIIVSVVFKFTQLF